MNRTKVRNPDRIAATNTNSPIDPGNCFASSNDYQANRYLAILPATRRSSKLQPQHQHQTSSKRNKKNLLPKSSPAAKVHSPSSEDHHYLNKRERKHLLKRNQCNNSNKHHSATTIQLNEPTLTNPTISSNSSSKHEWIYLSKHNSSKPFTSRN